MGIAMDHYCMVCLNLNSSKERIGLSTDERYYIACNYNLKSTDYKEYRIWPL